MRVIAGTARSLRLKTIEGLDTRPTTDRIKETLFNMLTGDTYDADFLDLFAGSGSIGIEALSRGSRSCTFVEQSPAAVKCINDNLKFTKLIDKASVFKTDALGFVTNMKSVDYDVIFMDPPYGRELEKNVLSILASKEFCRDTLIVVEATKDENFDYLDEMGYDLIKEKLYKSNKHVFIRKA